MPILMNQGLTPPYDFANGSICSGRIKMVKQTLYSGGLIYDGLHQVLEGQAVLVENKRIKEVGPVGDFQWLCWGTS